MKRPASLRSPWGVFALLFALAAVAFSNSPPASADRGAAEFFATRGEQSLKAKAWPEAEEQFRKALTEDATFLPARHGLGQALLGAGRTAPALEELRSFVSAVNADAAAPADWKTLATRTTKQLSDIDAAGAELRKILDQYSNDLLALAKKHLAKDPVTAVRAARRVLEMRPSDSDATAIIERMGESAKGPPVPLFNGKDVSNWESVRFPQWSVEGDFLIGDSRDGAYIARSHEEFEHDFDLVMEARFIEERSQNPMLAILGTMTGDYDSYSLGVLNRKIVAFEATGEGKRRDICRIPLSEFSGTFDINDWNRYEIRFRGNEVEFFVNGTSVGKDARPEGRRKGFVGLQIQDGRIAFRKVEAQPR